VVKLINLSYYTQSLIVKYVGFTQNHYLKLYNNFRIEKMYANIIF